MRTEYCLHRVVGWRDVQSLFDIDGSVIDTGLTSTDFFGDEARAWVFTDD